MTQASYDLVRLCRNGLITRRPHANTYDLTPDGLAFARLPMAADRLSSSLEITAPKGRYAPSGTSPGRSGPFGAVRLT